MLSDSYFRIDDYDLRCCGNCVNLSGLFCLELKTVVATNALCDNYDSDDLSFNDRKNILLRKKL